MTEFGGFEVSQLPLDVRDGWLTQQATDDRLSSPYFTLGFARAVSAVRRDVRVLVQFDAGAPMAILPVQRGAFGHARPLGGPLGDHHGVISLQPGPADVQGLLRVGGIQCFDFYGAVLLDDALRDCSRSVQGSWVIDLSGGFDAFEAGRTAAEPKAFRNLRARYRKMEAEGVSVRLQDDREEVFEQALAWKSAQYTASHHLDVFAAGWPKTLLLTLGQLEQDDCQLIVSSLEIGGELSAVHVGMKSQQVLHYWFPSYDPAKSKFGPGLALLMELARGHQALGIEAIHLGPGEYDFKAHLASYQIPIGAGFVGSGPLVALRSACDHLEHWAERAPLGRFGALPGKAFRRIDKHAGFRAA